MNPRSDARMKNQTNNIPSEIVESDFVFERASLLSQFFNLKTVLNVVSVVSLFVIWAIVVNFGIYRFVLIPGPAEVLEWGVDWMGSKDFWIDASLSTLRVFGGFIAACLIAIPLGLMIGWNKVFADLTFPTLEILRPIPGIAYIPLAILFFPWEEASVAFICFVGAFFPILLNTITGVRLIDRDFFRAARCLGSKPKHIFWHIVIPGALPSIATGAALGMGIAWMAVVAGEMISGKWGLGYRIWESYTLIRYPLIVNGMIVIGILGLCSSVAIRFVTLRLIPWRKAITESLDASITK
jgi:NitT/TauT family transport system permease protein